jgi:hypothetical protein
MNTRIGVAPQGEVLTWRRHGDVLFAIHRNGVAAMMVDVHGFTDHRCARLIRLAGSPLVKPYLNLN